MSTSVLYRAVGIRGYKHQSIKQPEGGLVMRVRHEGRIACPACGGSNVIRRGTVPGSWSAPPIGKRPVTVFAEVLRIECRDCRTEPVLPVPFADPRRSYTRSFGDIRQNEPHSPTESFSSPGLPPTGRERSAGFCPDVTAGEQLGNPAGIAGCVAVEWHGCLHCASIG